MAFTKRIVKLQFKLGKGELASGADTVEFEGLRSSVNIVREGIGFARAEIQVWGMSLDLMNKLTILTKLRFEEQSLNTVVVSAGDEQSGVSVCFGGIVREAWVDGREPPDLMFHVSADSALYETLRPIPPTSYKGSVDAALVLSGLASQLGYGFENSGVTAQLDNPYFPGSLKGQLIAVCQAAHCDYLLDDASRILAVWPKGAARDGVEALISKDTGLVAYPAFTQSGLRFTTLYNPSLEFGRKVRVESALKPANGSWRVASMAHRLESGIPGGMWFSDVECSFLDGPI